jgi:hypothetical protein
MTTPVKTAAAKPVTAESLAVENASLVRASRERVAARHGVSIDELQQSMQAKKSLHLIAAKMSEMNWGKGLDEMTRRAVAAYLERNRLDLTEVDVLGGNLYRNSRYYKRRLAEMVEDGKIEYVKSDWVHVDKRLDAHGDEWTANEKTRRERVRIEYGIPDAAVGACVFRVKVRGVDVEMTAAKWCGGGTRKSDPVGDQFPMEASETRACRRAMTLVASSIPALRWREDDLTEQGVELSAVIKDAHAQADANAVFAPPKQITSPGYGESAGERITPVVDPCRDSKRELTPEESLTLDAELAREE